MLNFIVRASLWQRDYSHLCLWNLNQIVVIYGPPYNTGTNVLGPCTLAKIRREITEPVAFVKQIF